MPTGQCPPTKYHYRRVKPLMVATELGEPIVILGVLQALEWLKGVSVVRPLSGWRCSGIR